MVSSPDLIRRVYCFQYNPCAILKAICAGVGFGSGTETSPGNEVIGMWFKGVCIFTGSSFNQKTTYMRACLHGGSFILDRFLYTTIKPIVY